MVVEVPVEAPPAGAVVVVLAPDFVVVPAPDVLDLVVVLVPAAPLAAGAVLVPELPERMLVPDRIVVLTPVRYLERSRSRTTMPGRSRSMITARGPQPRPQRWP